MRPSFLLLLLLGSPLFAQTATHAVFTVLTSLPEPPDRDRALMAYDEARARTLLAGGHTPGGGSVLQDTWEFNGSSWLQVSPANQLDFTRAVRMVWSPQRGQIVALIGENSAAGPPMRIHGWTGTDWVLVDGNGPPSFGASFEMAWDGQRGVLVVFAGAATWEWNGTIWQQRSTGGPVPRTGERMAYDESRQRVVLYGGLSYSNELRTDTWEWNGVYWLERFGITAPPSSVLGVIAYDRARQRVVLHGGYYNGNDTGGVFEFDGTSWVTRETSGGPSAMLNASMAYLPATNRMLLFGGNQGSTWQRTRTISFVTGYVAGSVAHQAGCLGPVGVPTLAPLGNSRPVLGTTFHLRFTNLPNSPLAFVFAALGSTDQTWGSLPLPIDLTPLGFSSCFLRIEPAILEPLANVGGIANWDIPVPSTPSLDGMQFFLQGLALTPGFNPGGAVTSSSRRCTAGVL